MRLILLSQKTYGNTVLGEAVKAAGCPSFLPSKHSSLYLLIRWTNLCVSPLSHPFILASHNHVLSYQHSTCMNTSACDPGNMLTSEKNSTITFHACCHLQWFWLENLISTKFLHQDSEVWGWFFHIPTPFPSLHINTNLQQKTTPPHSRYQAGLQAFKTKWKQSFLSIVCGYQHCVLQPDNVTRLQIPLTKWHKHISSVTERLEINCVLWNLQNRPDNTEDGKESKIYPIRTNERTTIIRRLARGSSCVRSNLRPTKNFCTISGSHDFESTSTFVLTFTTLEMTMMSLITDKPMT